MTEERNVYGVVIGEVKERQALIADQADEERQLKAVRAAFAERLEQMRLRILAGDLSTEEWQHEVQSRDLEVARWKERWDGQQQAISRLCSERHLFRVSLIELRMELGPMAAAEEKNGNYKTADVIRMMNLRLKEALESSGTVTETDIAKENEHESDQVRE